VGSPPRPSPQEELQEWPKLETPIHRSLRRPALDEPLIAGGQRRVAELVGESHHARMLLRPPVLVQSWDLGCRRRYGVQSWGAGRGVRYKPGCRPGM